MRYLEASEPHFDLCGAMWSDLGRLGVLRRRPRDAPGTARGALGELLGRSSGVSGCFWASVGGFLGDKIELESGNGAFLKIELPCRREPEF